MIKDPEIQRALRQLAPKVLQSSSILQMPNVLNAISKIRSSQPERLGFDRMVTDALASRADREKIYDQFKNMHSYIDWNRVIALRCQSIWL